MGRAAANVPMSPGVGARLLYLKCASARGTARDKRPDKVYVVASKTKSGVRKTQAGSKAVKGARVGLASPFGRHPVCCLSVGPYEMHRCPCGQFVVVWCPCEPLEAARRRSTKPGSSLSSAMWPIWVVGGDCGWKWCWC